MPASLCVPKAPIAPMPYGAGNINYQRVLRASQGQTMTKATRKTSEPIPPMGFVGVALSKSAAGANRPTA
eukprot:1709159-Lingulodinium_polyedra.AAC.1